MRVVLAALVCVLAELSSPVVAAPAPDIVGKSVLVSWTENRQELVGGQPVNLATGYDLRIYISSAGRPFTRLLHSTGRLSATHEMVGGSGTAATGGLQAVRVDGHTLVFQSTMGNYAKNLRVELSPGGSSCTAQMSIGKEVGSAPKAFRGVFTGRTVEIHAVTVGGVSCTVQQGNVFAN
jgi:hypothetical protein